jgi:hypothetical protein
LNDFLNPQLADFFVSRGLVRRGGFFGIHNGELVLHGEFFAPAFRRQVLAPLREKKKIEYTSVKGKANPVSPEYTASTIEFISIKKKRMK